MNSKKQLEVFLSKLKQIENLKSELEQYPTPSNIAAEILWVAYMNGDIKNKIVADLGCGNGIFGIGSLLLEAKKVFFLDVESASILVTKSNLTDLNLKNYILLKENIENFKEKVDIVIQNPPFGVQKEHADRIFLIKAMENSKKIYSVHKVESRLFIDALAKDYNFKLTNILPFDFLLKKTQEFHTKQEYIIKTGCFILEKL